jgi:hypothetical protein
LARRSSGWYARRTRLEFADQAAFGLFFVLTIFPMAPVNSAWWRFDANLNPEINERVGWQELTAEVARIYHAMPDGERAGTAILAFNYGEGGAINLYGPALGLPRAISGVNTYHYWGYGATPPEQVILLGATPEDAAEFLTDCDVVGHTPNPFGIENEETVVHPDIYLCRGTTKPWPEIWPQFMWFG